MRSWTDYAHNTGWQVALAAVTMGPDHPVETEAIRAVAQAMVMTPLVRPCDDFVCSNGMIQRLISATLPKPLQVGGRNQIQCER